VTRDDVNNNNNNNNLAAALTNSTYNHLLRNNILPKERKGCHRISGEYKDQLLVSKFMLSLVKKHQRHLCMASIDYQKAFNSLPHIRIVTVMEVYQICPTIRRFMGASMKEWKIEMWLYHTEGQIKTGKVAVKQGIFQGDSLPLLLLCLALIPLTKMLNKQEAEYEIKGKNKISH
jgi:hypothetical protein